VATSRDDIQDATGKRTYLAAVGHLRAWPGAGNAGDWTAGTGVPINGKAGYAHGCIWQNILGSGAGTALYSNAGSNTSSTWVNIV
jgi:hypothetical protein